MTALLSRGRDRNDVSAEKSPPIDNTTSLMQTLFLHRLLNTGFCINSTSLLSIAGLLMPWMLTIHKLLISTSSCALDENSFQGL